MIKKLVSSLGQIKIKDLIAIFIFLIAYPIAKLYQLFLKLAKKPLWLICESPDTARDNGYHLYQYIRTKHPEKKVYYAITKKAEDRKKIEKYGTIISYGSFKHWIYYLAAEKNISTQKAGNPNAPLFYVLQVYGILKSKRIFLQHGITKDDMDWLYYKNTKFSLFVCGAKKEFEYIKETFGYPENYVQYLGLARFDNLHNYQKNAKQILVMPTWRNWLGTEGNLLSGHGFAFKETNYYKRWNEFLTSPKLKNYIEENGITLYFYPHFNMQKWIGDFKKVSENIQFVDRTNSDIQELLKESSLLITDYSSVFMDFAYMKKPILFYQFDKKEYREKQYKVGYFSYEKDGFGPVYETLDDVIDAMIRYIENGYQVEPIYFDRMKDFFELNDTSNCLRNFEAIEKI